MNAQQTYTSWLSSPVIDGDTIKLAEGRVLTYPRDILTAEVEEFDPYAPIIIVPNDYQEGDEIEIIEE